MIRAQEYTEKIQEWASAEFQKHEATGIPPYEHENFCYVMEDDGEILGVITGYCTYAEVYIKDLVVKKEIRGKRIGSRLMEHVETEFKDKEYQYLTLTTFAYQAPDFYQKLGFEVEFIRRNRENPKLDKYYLSKAL